MRDGRPIRLALLGYALIILVVLVLSPFRFAWPSTWVVAWWSDVADVPVNFMLFLPLGYLLRLAFPGAGRGGALSALLFGLVVSAMVEVSQLFLETRLTSLTDLIGNSLGCATGAVLCNALRRRIDRTPRGVPTTDLPLTNLVYMLLPLMWLACAGVGTEPTRVWALAALGMAGALVMVGVWRFRLYGSLQTPRFVVMATVLVWFGLGAIFGIVVAPAITLKVAGAVLLVSGALLYLMEAHSGVERRFEARVLRGVWPWYLVYVLFITLGPELALTSTFSFTTGYPSSGFERNFSLRIAEQLAALTVLGYLIGESFSRGSLSPRTSACRNLVIAGVCAVSVEVLHGFLPDQAASLFRGTLSVLASAFGVFMYAAQLDVVRLLRHMDEVPVSLGKGASGDLGRERSS